MARSMLHYQHLDKEWWGEAVHTAAYLVNRLPNVVRRDMTPFELLTKTKPTLEHFRVFGSRGFVHVDKSKKSKWDKKAHRCIFLGYADGSKAYRVFDLDDDRMVVTRTVKLDERVPSAYREVVPRLDVGQHSVLNEDFESNIPPTQPQPASNTDMEVDSELLDADDVVMENNDAEVSLREEPSWSSPSTAVPRRYNDHLLEDEEGDQHQLAPAERAPTDPQPQTPARNLTFRPFPRSQVAGCLPAIPVEENRLVFSGSISQLIPTRQSMYQFLPSPASSTENQLVVLNPHSPNPELPPSRDEIPSSSSPMTSNSPSPEEVRENKRPRINSEYEIALAATEVPQTYREAMASPEAWWWKKAVRAEIQSHIRNHTWDIVRRPPGVKVIGCKWVFATKFGEHGKIVRYKARLVALGFLQTFGVDYNETYSPVASLNTVRMFLAVCCRLGYFIKQFDIETAFLNGDLEELVYMKIPVGIRAGNGMVCKLRRSLYGLKQAAAVWFRTIRSVFLAIGFIQCVADSCLFVRIRDDKPSYVVLYVDDLLVGCKTEAEADEICDELSKHFTVKALGDARFILGMEVQYDMKKGELYLRQTQFIKRMIDKFGRSDAFAVRSPFVIGEDLHSIGGIDSCKNMPYRELIGSLLYVANGSRPDISVQVGILSQFLENPQKKHWRAAVRVLRYLKGTELICIHYSRGGDDALVAYSDANWGGDINSRRSTSGVLLQFAGGPILFKSKKQSTVALSSAEAEYIALALAIQEVLWTRHLLSEMGSKNDAPVTIFVDNKSAISIATNNGYTPRAKHIDLRFRFVRDHVAQGSVRLEHVPSALQLADFLTKALPTPQFRNLINLSGLVEPSS